MKIRLHSGAKRDFDDAVRHYAAIRPELAGRFIDEVNAGFDQIIQDPQRWRVVGGSGRLQRHMHAPANRRRDIHQRIE